MWFYLIFKLLAGCLRLACSRWCARRPSWMPSAAAGATPPCRFGTGRCSSGGCSRRRSGTSPAGVLPPGRRRQPDQQAKARRFLKATGAKGVLQPPISKTGLDRDDAARTQLIWRKQSGFVVVCQVHPNNVRAKLSLKIRSTSVWLAVTFVP